MTEFSHSSKVAHLEARRSSQNTRCYRLHSHDTFSIGLIDAGRSTLTGSAEGPLVIETGDAVLIPRNHVHACNPFEGEWRYRMIHADQGWIATLMNPQMQNSLFKNIRVFRDSELQSSIGRIAELISEDADREHLETAFRDLFAVLDYSTMTGSITDDGDPNTRSRLLPAIDRLQHDEENPRIGDLAQLLSMNRYQFIRAMKRATGLSPLAWRQNARVLQARHMLRCGRSIADTAHALGFTDQSHFHRVFRAHVAASPGAYRNNVQDRDGPSLDTWNG